MQRFFYFFYIGVGGKEIFVFYGPYKVGAKSPFDVPVLALLSNCRLKSSCLAKPCHALFESSLAKNSIKLEQPHRLIKLYMMRI